MTRVAWIDAPSGVAGNMLLGALLDAGWPLDELLAVARALDLTDVRVDVTEVRRGGFRARLVDVAWDLHAHTHGVHLPQIEARIRAAALPAPVEAGALAVFRLLAHAEAAVHGEAVERIHFHEVGAVDALVDVVGAVAGFHALGVTRLVASPLPLGHGQTVCAHGTIPLPAPAVVAMLEGVAVRGVDVDVETVTPTGLAILKGLGATFGPMPDMAVVASGAGAGHRETGLPGPLRLLVGDPSRSDADAWERGRDVEIRAHVDDMNPQWFEAAFARVFESGAVDVAVAPIGMKKGRPGHLLIVLAPQARVDAVVRAILRHTSTIGVRLHPVEKRALPRRSEMIETVYGPVSVKIVSLDGEDLRVVPEHDDLARAAQAHGVSLEDVERALWAAALAGGRESGVAAPRRPPSAR